MLFIFPLERLIHLYAIGRGAPSWKNPIHNISSYWLSQIQYWIKLSTKNTASVKLGPFNIKSYATLISGGLFNSY